MVVSGMGLGAVGAKGGGASQVVWTVVEVAGFGAAAAMAVTDRRVVGAASVAVGWLIAVGVVTGSSAAAAAGHRLAAAVVGALAVGIAADRVHPPAASPARSGEVAWAGLLGLLAGLASVELTVALLVFMVLGCTIERSRRRRPRGRPASLATILYVALWAALIWAGGRSGHDPSWLRHHTATFGAPSVAPPVSWVPR